MIFKVKNPCHHVSAVLVTYNPNQETLCAAIQAIFNQVSDIFIVDNASENFSFDWLDEFNSQTGAKLHLLPQDENKGIAEAQNIGIKRAIKLGADFVLLLDQDSIASDGMVTELLAAITITQSELANIPVAAVGPTIIDRRTKRPYYFMTERKGLPHKWMLSIDNEKNLQPIEVAVLVASGTLISIEAMKHIGFMRSNYFINHVDNEWCFRARAMGYRLLGISTSKLEHQFGDNIKQIWFFGYRHAIYHSPLRNYYDVRNTLLMLRSTVMSWTWRIYFIWRLARLGYFLIFADQRWLRFQRIFLGLVHGFKDVSGCLDTETNQCHVIPVSSIEPE